jgi:hypothetical protein
MRGANRKRNARRASGEFGKATDDTPNDTATFPRLQRSAVNWFLDAAVFALDGDIASARLAAVRGVAAMGCAQ